MTVEKLAFGGRSLEFASHYLDAAGKTPISCSRGLNGLVSVSNSFFTVEIPTKSEANGA